MYVALNSTDLDSSTSILGTVSYPESRSETQPRYMSPQFMESFIQNEEGEPSEDFKKEINEHFAKQRGDQPLNVETESDKGIRYNYY